MARTRYTLSDLLTLTAGLFRRLFPTAPVTQTVTTPAIAPAQEAEPVAAVPVPVVPELPLATEVVAVEVFPAPVATNAPAVCVLPDAPLYVRVVEAGAKRAKYLPAPSGQVRGCYRKRVGLKGGIRYELVG